MTPAQVGGAACCCSCRAAALGSHQAFRAELARMVSSTSEEQPQFTSEQQRAANVTALTPAGRVQFGPPVSNMATARRW